METNPEIRQLYRELHQIDQDMKPLTTPRSADNLLVLTLQDLDRYYILRKRRNEIVAELAELEGEMP
jgi:hypothetical protein